MKMVNVDVHSRAGFAWLEEALYCVSGCTKVSAARRWTNRAFGKHVSR
jgi:hypothetical protein